MPDMVIKKIDEHLEFEKELGGYKAAENRVNEINGFYEEVAQLINSKPSNVAFAHDATDAYSKALSSIAFKEDDIVITTDDDYTSNQIQFLSLKKRFGISIKRINTKPNGDLDIDHFESLIKQVRPKLVSVTHVPTNSGLVQDVESIGALCEKYDILYLVDACQSVGQFSVDVHKIKCDFLSATGRKFLRGPRGTGFLFISDKVLNRGFAPLFVDGRGAVWTGESEYRIIETAKRFETWEYPYALMLGFKEAIKYLNSIGIRNVEAYNNTIIRRLRENLTSDKDVVMYDRGTVTCNILTFLKKGKTVDEIKEHLEKNAVFFSVSQKEWGLIDFNKKGVEAVIRISPHYFNTIQEIDALSEIINDI